MFRRVRRSFISAALVGMGAGFFFGTVTFVGLSLFAAATSPLESFLIVVSGFLAFLVLTLTIAYADSRRKRANSESRAGERFEEKLSGILQRLDGIFKVRTGLSAYLLENRDDKIELEACANQSSEFLRYLINETRFLFEDYTGQPCAASIKLLVSADDGIPLIKTFLRDKKSQLLRGDLYGSEGLYPFDKHSPFVDIVAGRAAGDYYICNDLRTAFAKGTYRNGNRHWWKLYNSTIVVPIKDPSTSFSENVVGFLCVDSVSAKFDQSVCLHVSRIIANVIFYVVYALSQLESKLQKSEPGPVSSAQDRRIG